MSDGSAKPVDKVIQEAGGTGPSASIPPNTSVNYELLTQGLKENRQKMRKEMGVFAQSLGIGNLQQQVEQLNLNMGNLPQVLEQAAKAQTAVLDAKFAELKQSVDTAMEKLAKPVHEMLPEEWERMDKKQRKAYVKYLAKVEDYGQFKLVKKLRKAGRSKWGGALMAVGVGVSLLGGGKAAYDMGKSAYGSMFGSGMN